MFYGQPGGSGTVSVHDADIALIDETGEEIAYAPVAAAAAAGDHNGDGFDDLILGYTLVDTYFDPDDVPTGSGARLLLGGSW